MSLGSESAPPLVGLQPSFLFLASRALLQGQTRSSKSSSGLSVRPSERRAGVRTPPKRNGKRQRTSSSQHVWKRGLAESQADV